MRGVVTLEVHQSQIERATGPQLTIVQLGGQRQRLGVAIDCRLQIAHGKLRLADTENGASHLVAVCHPPLCFQGVLEVVKRLSETAGIEGNISQGADGHGLAVKRAHPFPGTGGRLQVAGGTSEAAALTLISPSS